MRRFSWREGNPAVAERAEKSGIQVRVDNVDRTFGTLLGAEITRRHPEGLAGRYHHDQLHGTRADRASARLSRQGLTICLTGDSNDYFGKGLSGGKLIVHAPSNACYDPQENIIIGNVALTAPRPERLTSPEWRESGSPSAIPGRLRGRRRRGAWMRIYDRRRVVILGKVEELCGRHERRHRLCPGRRKPSVQEPEQTDGRMEA